MSTDLAIIIYSCWRNRDMWPIFSKLFRKYWEDCPYQVVLVTDEYKEASEDYVFTKVVTLDDTWGRMIKEAVKQAGTPYVMLWMDDYLLCDRISNKEIEKHIQRAKEYHAGNLRLLESPKCNGKYQGKENIGYYERGIAYSLTTQVGLWDVEFLCGLIKDEWSAWEFERIASLEKVNTEQPILASLDYVFPYEEGVRKGKWMVAGANLCRRNGIDLESTGRPVMTNLEMAKIYFQGAILDWNPTFVVRWQNRLQKRKKR